MIWLRHLASSLALQALIFSGVAVGQVAEKALMVVVQNNSNAERVLTETASTGMSSVAIQSFWSDLEVAHQQDFADYEGEVNAAVQAAVPSFNEPMWQEQGMMVEIPAFSATAYKGSAVQVDAMTRNLEQTAAQRNGQIVVIEFTKLQYIDDRYALASNLPVPQAVSTTSPAWGVRQIRAPEVWNRGVRGNGVIVAVIDSGVDRNHPAFASSDKLIMDVKNNLVQANRLPLDDVTFQNSSGQRIGGGHGTHVAGIIAGLNGIGVAPNARILPIKVFDNRFGNAVDFFIAVDRALAAGARVINMSFGEPLTDPTGVTTSQKTFLFDRWSETVRGANRKGVVVVAAAGNVPGPPSWGNDNGDVLMPGAVSEVITVAASTKSNAAAGGSRPLSGIQLRRKSPDVGAPGGDWTTGGVFREGVPSARSGGTDLVDFPGTSMAAPHVSGLCALLLSHDSTLTPNQIKNRITSHTLPNTATARLGRGVVDAYEAVFVGGEPHPEVDVRLSDVIKKLEDIRADIRTLRPGNGGNGGNGEGRVPETESTDALRTISEGILWQQRDSLEERIEKGTEAYDKFSANNDQLGEDLESARKNLESAKKGHATKKKLHAVALTALRTMAATAANSSAEAIAEKSALDDLNASAKTLTAATKKVSQVEKDYKDNDQKFKDQDKKLDELDDRMKRIQSRLGK